MGHMVSSVSSWFNQMAVTAEGVYFSKGIQSVIKAEDPEYLDMVDYFVNLEGRLTMIRDCVARLSRSYVTMGTLWGEFGANAVAVSRVGRFVFYFVGSPSGSAWNWEGGVGDIGRRTQEGESCSNGRRNVEFPPPQMSGFYALKLEARLKKNIRPSGEFGRRN